MITEGDILRFGNCVRRDKSEDCANAEENNRVEPCGERDLFDINCTEAIEPSKEPIRQPARSVFEPSATAPPTGT